MAYFYSNKVLSVKIFLENGVQGSISKVLYFSKDKSPDFSQVEYVVLKNTFHIDQWDSLSSGNVSSLPEDKIWYLSKLKTFEDDK